MSRNTWVVERPHLHVHLVIARRGSAKPRVMACGNTRPVATIGGGVQWRQAVVTCGGGGELDATHWPQVLHHYEQEKKGGKKRGKKEIKKRKKERKAVKTPTTRQQKHKTLQPASGHGTWQSHMLFIVGP
jgi:hypothetical protein